MYTVQSVRPPGGDGPGIYNYHIGNNMKLILDKITVLLVLGVEFELIVQEKEI